MQISKIYPYNFNVKNKNTTEINSQKYYVNSKNEIAELPKHYYPYNVTFGALNWNEINKYTEILSKRIYSKRNINLINEEFKDAKGITAGRGIPDIWTSRIKDIKNFDKDSFIEDFGKLFSEERSFADIDKLKQKLSELFKSHKIIDDKTLLEVKYIGHGFQAWAYRIIVGNEKDKSIVVKLFKHHNNILQNHGNKTEQNLAEYVRAYTNNNSEFVKYYYGDNKNGIMLVDYIPRDIEPPEHKLDLSDIGIGYGDDFPKNRINGHICDYGGIETISNLIGNKSAQDVHKAIKYASSDDEKIKIFNDIYIKREDTDEFKDKAIGLVHGIKHMPKEMQVDLYKKCFALKSHRVNIALIQNIKNFSHFDDTTELINNLVLDAYDQKELETIAKEIKHIPEKPRHIFFEQQENTTISAIIKYLARNINHYYKDLPNRRNIYNKFIDNCDTYSGMALINSMKHMSSSRYDEYFEKFYAKNDAAINTALARSLELFNEDIALQKKWINKLLECKNADVDTALAESISFIDRDNRQELFEKLLPLKNKNAKEFLADNIITVPQYSSHNEWIIQLLDGSDNLIKSALLNTIRLMPKGSTKTKWINIISESGDETVKNMANEI